MDSHSSQDEPLDSQPPGPESDTHSAPVGDEGYVVVARRYRPQTFDQLVGQQHVTRALGNAIETGRVGHAYLFTGARGVGKTSAARIFAKALQCVDGPAPAPCNRCDICRGISSGDDMDVLEIDGASNRGIDEIRQLRSNVNIRPSRTRFKIYIIDEVHMLTIPAFNALLKTLEEPPEHVKFIFCTTDPEKMPITVLSRCQRFDFSPVETPAIVDRLQHIVDTEGVEAEPEALEILARRAAGSMRDSQSLLEQLLSFGGEGITVQSVHQMLGTAQSGRLGSLLDRLVARDAAGALAELDAAVAEGVDVGQLVEQLLGYYRDLMAVRVGCSAGLTLFSPESDFDRTVATARELGLETILAAVQILDQAATRMRQSVQGRTLTEVALVRICNLEYLDELSSIVAELRRGEWTAEPGSVGLRTDNRSASSVPAAARRPTDSARESGQGQSPPSSPTESSPPKGPPARPPAARLPEADISAEDAEKVWRRAIEQMGSMTAGYAEKCQTVAISAPNRLVVTFSSKYTSSKPFCERPDRLAEIEKAVAALVGGTVKVAFEVAPEADGPARSVPKTPAASTRQRLRDVSSHPIVRQAAELFGAEVTRLDEPRDDSGR